MEMQQLPNHIARRLAVKMKWFADQKNPMRYSKALKNFPLGTHRFRVGDYRIIVQYIPEERVLIVSAVFHRSKAYE